MLQVLLADEVEDDAARVRMGAVFPYIDALPGAKSELAIVDRDGEVDGGQGCANVRRHIVIAFGGVDEDRIAIANEAGEEGIEVATDVGVSVLLDQE